MSVAPKITDLPYAAMARIARHVLDLTEPGTLRPDPNVLNSLVTLCQTSQKFRKAVAISIDSLIFPDAERLFWPNVSIISPSAWSGLRTVDCVINRSQLIAFLKWGTAAKDITHLRLHVVGEPYPIARLEEFERTMLGRMLTQVAGNLVELEISGINCQAVLFACLFQCTRLRKFCMGAYGDANPTTLLSVMILLCLVNRDHLEVVKFPYDEWSANMESVPDGKTLYANCRIAWENLFSSFKSGMKESALNIPAEGEELIASFQEMERRIDLVQASMRISLDELKELSISSVSQKDPRMMLLRLLPKVRTLSLGAADEDS